MYTPSGARSLNDQSTRTPWRTLLLVLFALAGFASASSAQSLSPGGPVDFGGVPVATTSGITTLIFSVPAGDVVTVSISKLGTIENRVVAEAS